VEHKGLNKSATGRWFASFEPDEAPTVFGMRVTAHWQGSELQAVRRFQTESGEIAARIVYTGRSGNEAESIGLQQTDAGIYEATVPWHELENVEAVHFREKQIILESGIRDGASRDLDPAFTQRTGINSHDFGVKPRNSGLWLNTVDGWFPSTQTPQTRAKFLKISTFHLIKHDGGGFQCSLDEILGAHFITQWCTFHGLRWRIMALYDDDGTLKAEANPTGEPLNLDKSFAYEAKHRKRFPVALDDPTIHIFVIHDSEDPKPFAEYQEIAENIPNGEAIHPRAYNGSRLEARVPLTDIFNYQQIVEWTYGDQT